LKASEPSRLNHRWGEGEAMDKNKYKINYKVEGLTETEVLIE